MWLRTATMNDIAAIHRLLVETWHTACDDLPGAALVEQIASRWHSPAMLKQYLSHPSSEYTVADNGTALCGVAYARQGSAQAGADRIMLHQLYVHPHFQGQGIGKSLLAEMESCFPSAKHMRLTVFEKNRKAIQFYSSQGYKSMGEPLPISENPDIYEIVMEKYLAN